MKYLSLAVLTVLVGAFATPADEEKKPNTQSVIITALDLTQGTMSARLNADGGGVSQYNLLRETKVMLDGKDAKLADLKVGMRIEITTQPKGDDIVAITGKTQTASGPNPSGRQIMARGAFKGHNAETNEIVLQIRGDGNRIFDRTYPLGKDVAVIRNKETIALKDIKMDEELVLFLAADRQTALKILVGKDGERKEGAPKEGEKKPGEKKEGDKKEGEKK